MTEVVHVTPVDRTGRLDGSFQLTDAGGSATCPLTSKVVDGAVTCTVGDVFYDPCWPVTQATPAVVCLSEPRSKDLVRLRLAEADLPSSSPANVYDLPWFVELQSGAMCRLATGAHSRVGSRDIEYYCGENEETVLLRDTLDRTSRRWTIEAAVKDGDDHGYRVVGSEAIVRAWFA